MSNGKNTIVSNALKSWKTTLCGLIPGIVILYPELDAIIKDKPFYWQMIILGVFLISGGIVARDGNKSSEDVGAK